MLNPDLCFQPLIIKGVKPEEELSRPEGQNKAAEDGSVGVIFGHYERGEPANRFTVTYFLSSFIYLPPP